MSVARHCLVLHDWQCLPLCAFMIRQGMWHINQSHLRSAQTSLTLQWTFMNVSCRQTCIDCFDTCTPDRPVLAPSLFFGKEATTWEQAYTGTVYDAFTKSYRSLSHTAACKHTQPSARALGLNLSDVHPRVGSISRVKLRLASVQVCNLVSQKAKAFTSIAAACMSATFRRS
jgi:hypothetical protein